MKCRRSSLETADGIPSEEPHPGLYHNVVTTADEALQDREPRSMPNSSSYQTSVVTSDAAPPMGSHALVQTQFWSIPNSSLF